MGSRDTTTHILSLTRFDFHFQFLIHCGNEDSKQCYVDLMQSCMPICEWTWLFGLTPTFWNRQFCFVQVREELRMYNPAFVQRPHVVALNKLDLLGPDGEEWAQYVKNRILNRVCSCHLHSSRSGVLACQDTMIASCVQ